MLIKKLLILVILGIFLIGAFGGCFTFDIPNLSGNWEGTLRSAKNPLIPASLNITDLTQDPNGNFTGGSITITYNVDNTNHTLDANIIPNESSTDEFRARMKFKGYVDDSVIMTAIIFALTGTTIPLSDGDYYILTMTLPHMYGCVESDLDKITGPYEFHIYTEAAPVGQKFDEGTATLEKAI